MKSFDLNTVGKRMPYTTPSEEFFESFTHETLARIEREARLCKPLRRIIFSAMTAAAMVAVILTVSLRGGSNDTLNDFDLNLDQYVELLSDDELNSLLYDIEAESEFYTNL